jgi:hypothetical protein
MGTLTVIARLRNNDVMERPGPPDLLLRIEQLQARGFEGKRLIHEALTDDWGVPPIGVDIMDGDRLVLRIPYT